MQGDPASEYQKFVKYWRTQGLSYHEINVKWNIHERAEEYENKGRNELERLKLREENS